MKITGSRNPFVNLDIKVSVPLEIIKKVAMFMIYLKLVDNEIKLEQRALVAAVKKIRIKQLMSILKDELRYNGLMTIYDPEWIIEKSLATTVPDSDKTYGELIGPVIEEYFMKTHCKQ